VITDGEKAFEFEHELATRAPGDPRWPRGRERRHLRRLECYGRQIVEFMKAKPKRNTARRKADAHDYEAHAVPIVGVRQCFCGLG
jgi:hypothetical protein